MHRGVKSKYTNKQKRQAEHIEEGYKSNGVSEETAEKIVWATVNQERKTDSRKDKDAPKGEMGNRAANSEKKDAGTLSSDIDKKDMGNSGSSSEKKDSGSKK